ncbi:MaoC/PaaZ C-terminal domain-containing protein [Mesorhizobium sp. ANAO-SY3R2]|uniref:MaoC family dehydratase n=1 Tax=Mesorhizobium sp. ANAO-SY3R2 TaxID=3166644 RepID=UPI00366DC487
MAIVYDKLLNWHFDEISHAYRWQDSSLYALSTGFGTNPLSRQQLNYIYEPWIQAVPTMATVIANPGFWVRHPDTGIDWANSLHGEQEIVLHKPLPAEATMTGRMKVESIIDRGEGKGAILTTRNDLHDSADDTLVASVYATAFMRTNGGFGGPTGPRRPVVELPERAPDISVDLPTLPQAALLYRLNGDYNPLHIEPEVATGAGFKEPILHGLCTYGVACHALLSTVCDYDAAAVKSMRGRFSAPVYPGETIRTDIWHDGPNRVNFRCLAVERNLVVLTGGQLELRQ